MAPQPQPARSHPDISAAAREPVQPGLHRRASTFPKQNTSAPTAQTPTFDQRAMGYAAPAQSSGSSTGPYTPTSTNFGPGAFAASAMEDSSPNNLLPYGFGADIAQPNLPDLSAMMFPSAEPFNYPNQPLTTFENNQFSKDPAVFSNFNATSTPSMMPSRQANVTESDNLEAQFYTLPPYMMAQQQQQQHQRRQQQQQQQQQQQRQQAGWDVTMPTQMNGMRQMSGSSQMDASMMGGIEGWGGQQAATPNPGFSGVNLSEIFGGEEWNGMLMDQGFRH